MRLKSGLTKTKIGEDYVVVSDDRNLFKGMIRLNESGALIFDILNEKETSEDELSVRIMAEYDVEKETCEKDIKKYLQTFRDCGLIENE